MFCHHCFTIVLIGFSFYIGHTPVGCLVIILHNISDVPLQLGKLVNYKQWIGIRKARKAPIAVSPAVFSNTPDEALRRPYCGRSEYTE